MAGGTAAQSVTTRSGGRKKKDVKDEDEPKKYFKTWQGMNV